MNNLLRRMAVAALALATLPAAAQSLADRSAWGAADERAVLQAQRTPVHLLTYPPQPLGYTPATARVNPAVLAEQARVDAAVREFARTQRWDRDVFSGPPAPAGFAQRR